MAEPMMIVGIVRMTDEMNHLIVFELAQDQYLAPNIRRYKMDWPKQFPLPAVDSTFEIAAQPTNQGDKA